MGANIVGKFLYRQVTMLHNAQRSLMQGIYKLEQGTSGDSFQPSVCYRGSNCDSDFTILLFLSKVPGILTNVENLSKVNLN